MSEYFSSDLEERLDSLAEWDELSLMDALHITTKELLDVPEFRHRAEQWIKDNY